MKVLIALAAGYVLGARNGRDDLEDVIRSLRAMRESEEFRDLVASVRAHAGHTLRDLASMVEASAAPGDSDAEVDVPSTHDLVERVRHLAGLR